MYRIITPTKTTTHDTEHAVNPYIRNYIFPKILEVYYGE